MKQEIQNILNDLLSIRKDNNLKIEDSILFSETIKIYISQYIQSSKEKNIKAVQEKPKAEKPATPGQLKYVNSLSLIHGFPMPKELTGMEAHAIIEKYKGEEAW